jgi:hypothetical protein
MEKPLKSTYISEDVEVIIGPNAFGYKQYSVELEKYVEHLESKINERRRKSKRKVS